MRKILFIAIACLGVAALFLIDRWQVAHWRNEKVMELDATLQLCQTRLKNSIISRFDALEALAALFVLHPATNPEEFSHFASLLLQFNPPIRALQYADANTRVKYVYPPKGNEITIKDPLMLLTDPKRGPFVKKAIHQKRAVLQGPFELRQGGAGAVLRLPIFRQGSFIGLSIGVYDISVLVTEAFEGLNLNQFVINLKDNQGNVFWNSGDILEGFNQKSFSVANTTWSVAANWGTKPNPTTLPRILVSLCGLGFLLSTLFAIQSSWKQEQRLENIIDERTRELSKSNEALQKSEERFDLAMKFANDGLFDWNLETNQIYYSPGWKRLLGYEDEEINNEFSEWERLTNSEDVKASMAMLNEVLNGKRERFEKEFKMLHKNGQRVDILSRANAIFNEADC